MQASGWAVDLYRKLFGADHDPSDKVLGEIEQTIADTRAAGYAEAIEKAAKLIEEYTTIGSDVATEIRMLAPAATTEEP